MKFFVLLILLFGMPKANAQNVYRTKEGHIEMMALVTGKTYKAESHKLALNLDYGSKVVNGVLDLKTLVTNNPIIKATLERQEEPLLIEFTGSLPSEDFLSRRHDPISFNWPIRVNYRDRSFKSNLKGTITHIDQSMAMSCLISARGEIDAAGTGLDVLLKGIEGGLQIEFAQMVLKLDN